MSSSPKSTEHNARKFFKCVNTNQLTCHISSFNQSVKRQYTVSHSKRNKRAKKFLSYFAYRQNSINRVPFTVIWTKYKLVFYSLSKYISLAKYLHIRSIFSMLNPNIFWLFDIKTLSNYGRQCSIWIFFLEK